MMARQPCPICTSEHRSAIDAELLERRLSYRAIADQFGVSLRELKTHNSAHIPCSAIPRGDNTISDGGPDVRCLEDAIAREVLGPSSWRHYVEHWRREQKRRG